MKILCVAFVLVVYTIPLYSQEAKLANDDSLRNELAVNFVPVIAAFTGSSGVGIANFYYKRHYALGALRASIKYDRDIPQGMSNFSSAKINDSTRIHISERAAFSNIMGGIGWQFHLNWLRGHTYTGMDLFAGHFESSLHINTSYFYPDSQQTSNPISPPNAGFSESISSFEQMEKGWNVVAAPFIGIEFKLDKRWKIGAEADMNFELGRLKKTTVEYRSIESRQQTYLSIDTGALIDRIMIAYQF